MDPRAINFNVLRRHDPHISSIIDSTSYAVIYRYFHGAWSKTGFEGTMFVFQRDILPRYGVFVLNRQGLDNLCEGLLPGWDVDLDEGLIIWRSAGATGEADDDIIYGIWVYEEKDRSRIATTMQSLIDTAAANQDLDPDPDPDPDPPSSSPPPVSLSHPVPRVPIITAGQSISLDQLFGVSSVCSDPPPQTSALPHPGASVVDPDEHPDGQLPSKVMSPDPSDLPKGMQLLDSLFHKAGIRSQPSNQSLASEPAAQPLSIQQLLHGPPSSHAVAPAATKPPEPAPRERRRSSNSESYQPQTVPDAGHHPAHRTLNPSSRPEHRATNPHGSRRSSAGSSSHSRSDKAPQPGHHHHSTHTYPAHPGTMVAAPVPIENANAEARHNILSLLGHPAAARPSHGYPAGANGQAQASGGGRLRGSPDSFGSAGKEGVYGSGRGGGGGPGSIYSHAGSQQASPQHGGQGATPPSYPGAHTSSADHSPNHQPGPVSGQHSHSPSGPRQPDSRAPHGGAAFMGSVWPFDKIPTRALSPLNPAAQQYRHGSPGTSLRTSGQLWKQPHPASPPVVNDSSRPGRTGSYGSSSGGAAGSGSVKSKVAVECLDEVLGEGKFGVGEIDGGSGSGGRDGAPVDKKMFVSGILELIKTNGAFVDSLYARYLARYAERYL